MSAARVLHLDWLISNLSSVVLILFSLESVVFETWPLMFSIKTNQHRWAFRANHQGKYIWSSTSIVPNRSVSSRFRTAGLHPQLLTRVQFDSPPKVAPGAYDLLQYGSFSEKNVQRRAQGPNWQQGLYTEQMARIPHSSYKETYEKQKDSERRLGPGTYQIPDFLAEAEKKPQCSRGALDQLTPRFPKDQPVRRFIHDERWMRERENDGLGSRTATRILWHSRWEVRGTTMETRKSRSFVWMATRSTHITFGGSFFFCLISFILIHISMGCRARKLVLARTISKVPSKNCWTNVSVRKVPINYLPSIDQHRSIRVTMQPWINGISHRIFHRKIIRIRFRLPVNWKRIRMAHSVNWPDFRRNPVIESPTNIPVSNRKIPNFLDLALTIQVIHWIRPIFIREKFLSTALQHEMIDSLLAMPGLSMWVSFCSPSSSFVFLTSTVSRCWSIQSRCSSSRWNHCWQTKTTETKKHRLCFDDLSICSAWHWIIVEVSDDQGRFIHLNALDWIF